MFPWISEPRKEWPPYVWPIFVALIIGATCGFAISSFWWSGTVSALRERVSILQESRSQRELRIVDITKEPSYRVQPDDDVIQVDNPDKSPITVYLPTGFPIGRLVTIKDKRGNANAVPIQIVPDNGTVDGFHALVINVDRGWVSVIWNGTDWSEE